MPVRPQSYLHYQYTLYASPHSGKSSNILSSTTMAMNFSPAASVGSIYQQKPYVSPRNLLYLQQQDSHIGRCKISSWGAASSYVKLEARVVRSFAARAQLKDRRAVFRCATIEEIEEEKALIEEDAKERMDKTLDNLRANFNSIRTGRSNPAMLDKIEVEYYGSPTSLKSIAQISTPDSSSLLVKPYDKSALKGIEKAIVNSDLGMTPNNDGDTIRLTLPQLTSERRKEMSKIVAKQSEDGKVAIRNIRRDAIKAYEKLEKEKKLSEDNVKDLSSDLQKLTDEYMKKIEALFKQKEKELLTV